MKTTVGRSHRTPAKHDLMNRTVGREVSVAGRVDAISEEAWFDLTAGDGVVHSSEAWVDNCSPGILAKHARRATKPLTVRLYEISGEVYTQLLANLAEQLPMLGYEGAGAVWRYGDHVRLLVHHGSGADAPVDVVRSKTAVLVTNDPNAITEWAMRPEFAAEINARTNWFQCISTMGCNPAGLKRRPYEEREQWPALIEQQHRLMPPHHDLILAAISKDDAQWAYLLCAAVRWRDRVEQDIHRAFAKHGMAIEYAWSRTNISRFCEMQDRLFLTRKELLEATQIPLFPGDEPA